MLKIGGNMVQDQGSLEKAVNGDYDFSIGDIIAEAWERVKGAKLKIIGALVIYILIASLATGIISIFFEAKPYYDAGETAKGFLTDMLISWLASPVTIPLVLGLLLLGYSRANDEELRIDSIFNYYVLVWPLVFATLLISVFTYIGFVLLVLPGIYLSVAYNFTLPLMVDKKLGIWGAMEVSRQAVTKHWFTLFGVYIALAFLLIISAIPFGIGLIWTVPLALIAHGIMYRKIFGWKVHDPIIKS
jgi:hypothetical protein